MEMPTRRRKALEGIRVLDLTRLLPGPYCTMILADFGAEVIKVEEPGRGDYYRWLEPMMGEYGASFQLLNRNKKSIALNLKDPAAKDIFMDLVPTAHVIVEGFRPGVMDRLGIGYDSVRKLNPRIVYCSITGFGPDGPYRDVAAHDINYIAIGGVLGLTGRKGGTPVIPGVQVADIGAGGLYAAVGILIALLASERLGVGQYVDVAMLDGVVAWLAGAAAWHFATGRSPGPGELRLTGGFPWYNVYETRDGKWISVGALEEKFWVNLCKGIGREDLIPCYHWPEDKYDKIKSELAAVFASKTRAEWMEVLAGTDSCVTQVNTLTEVFLDPQVSHRKLVSEVQAGGSSIKLINTPVKMSETPSGVERRAPRLGEHTEEILASLGRSKEEVARLRERGAIA